VILALAPSRSQSVEPIPFLMADASNSELCRSYVSQIGTAQATYDKWTHLIKTRGGDPTFRMVDAYSYAENALTQMEDLLPKIEVECQDYLAENTEDAAAVDKARETLNGVKQRAMAQIENNPLLESLRGIAQQGANGASFVLSEILARIAVLLSWGSELDKLRRIVVGP
jgi:hypothetical protein